MKTKVAIIGFIYVCSLLNAQDSNQINNMINELLLLLYLERQLETSSEVICLDNYPVNFSFSEEILEKDVKFMSLHTPLGHRGLQRNKEYKFIFPQKSCPTLAWTTLQDAAIGIAIQDFSTSCFI